MEVPLITVLMPVYNAEKYIAESIDSILNQTYTDFELLIINDGSTDNSVNIINSYHDKRIRLIHNEENIKLIETLNKGIGLAKGKYICRVDADDINCLTRLETQLNFLEQNPAFVACASWIETFYENSTKGGVVKYEEAHDDIRVKTLYQNHFCHPASFFRKDFIVENNFYFDKRFIHSEDYYFFVKLSELGQLHNIQEALVRVRKHESNVSVLNCDVQNKNSINVIKYQLGKIGIETDDIDFDLYYRFFYAAFDLNKSEIDTIENLILKIIDANKISQYLPHKKLVEFLAEKWYHLCVNSTRFGMWIYNKFSNSEIPKQINVNLYNNYKFIIKSALKYDYSKRK